MLSAVRILAALSMVAVGLAASPPSSIVVDGTPFRVVVRPMTFADCHDAAAKLAGKEIALAHIAYHFRAVADPADRMHRLLAAVVDTDTTTVELPDISWPAMTSADLEAVDRVTDAVAVHERGHLQIALDAAAEATQLHHVIVPGADTQAEVAISHMMDERQKTYDAITGHGVHQSRAPSPLDGNDVKLICR